MLNYINDAIKTLPAAAKLIVLVCLAAVSVMGGVTVKLYNDQNALHQQLLTQKDQQIDQLLTCTKDGFAQQQQHDARLQSIAEALYQIQYTLGMRMGQATAAQPVHPN